MRRSLRRLFRLALPISVGFNLCRQGTCTTDAGRQNPLPECENFQRKIEYAFAGF